MGAWIAILLFGIGMGAYGLVAIALDRHREPPLRPAYDVQQALQAQELMVVGALGSGKTDAFVVTRDGLEHLLRRVRELEEALAQRTTPTPSR